MKRSVFLFLLAMYMYHKWAHTAFFLGLKHLYHTFGNTVEPLFKEPLNIRTNSMGWLCCQAGLGQVLHPSTVGQNSYPQSWDRILTVVMGQNSYP